MTVFHAILLGAIQGLAEFLPISSSGHLAVAEHFLGHSHVPILFDILLHVATLAAVFLVFYKPILRLLCVLVRFIAGKKRPRDAEDLALITALIISTLVTGVIGIALKDIVKTKNLACIALGFITTGLILYISGNRQKKATRTSANSTVSLCKVNCANDSEKSVAACKKKAAAQIPTFLSALIIGAAQGIGVLPGISRSGSTIAAAFLTGLDREKAGEYSFLLAIPAILAAFILECKSADTLGSSVAFLPLAAGMLTAFIAGLCSLIFLLNLIKNGKLGMFAYYLIPAGMALLAAWYF